MLKSIIKYTYLFAIILSLLSCSSHKREFKNLDVGVFPVIVNNGRFDIDSAFYQQLSVSLLIAKLELEKDVNVHLEFADPIIMNQLLEVECPYREPRIEVETPYKRNVILFINIPNQCSNILGCAGVGAIEENLSTLLITVERDQIDTAATIIHEMGHILGATHFNDTYIMTASQRMTFHLSFSDYSLDEIYNTLQPIYEKDGLNED